MISLDSILLHSCIPVRLGYVVSESKRPAVKAKLGGGTKYKGTTPGRISLPKTVPRVQTNRQRSTNLVTPSHTCQHLIPTFATLSQSRKLLPLNDSKPRVALIEDLLHSLVSLMSYLHLC